MAGKGFVAEEDGESESEKEAGAADAGEEVGFDQVPEDAGPLHATTPAR